VPCHRIIHADGSIGAYGFGADLKVLLLEHEGALL
jgi:O6-methylguanine-DNA--protein-cysteine methyltransferase